MDGDEQAFLAAIEASPEDEAPHRVFADWLDDHDRPEDAAYHRRWTVEIAQAEARLRKLADEKLYGESPDNIRQLVKEKHCHGSDSLSYDLQNDIEYRAQVFNDWELYSGERVSLVDFASGYFKCGC